jgi:type VI secretion system secreted protein VgrG
VLEESTPAGDGEAGYRNEFLAAPWDALYRPPLRHPKPQVLGYQTAVVTGPAGEEIHCDRHGRVKVQFFWDREGQGDDRSSCWLRVASGWAGERIGGLGIPRVGMEVLVEFLEGDPDQPVVAGCLFHGEHPAPYALPAHRTRSVLRTRSSPGGDGFNEMHVEDKAGQEQLFVHAQRDWDQSIGRDQKIRVGQQRHDCVQANSYSQFHAEEHRTTLGHRKTEIQGGDHLVVGDNQHLKVGQAHLLEAGREIHVKAGQHLVIEAGQELTVQAGGSFIRLDAQGLLLAGSEVDFNGAGAPQRGSGVAVLRPALPKPVAASRPGGAPAAQPAPVAPGAEPAAPQYCLDIRLTDVPGETGFPLANTHWQIHEDGQDAPLLEGFSDAAGQVLLDAPQRQRLVAAKSSLWLCYCGQRLPVLLTDEPADAQRQRFALSALDFHDCLSHPRADAASQARADQELAEAGDLYGQLHDGEA